MSNLKFGYDIQGFNELRKSPEVQEMLRTTAQNIANRAGPDFESEVVVKETRAVATVRAEGEAIGACMEDPNILIRALKGGG